MEHLAAQPQQEQLKSFDVLASVDMFAFDLIMYGYVLPETRARVCDEELSLVTEGIDRASCSEFSLQRQNGQLQYFDKGEWRPYGGSLMTGLEVAKREAAVDPRRQFLAERAAFDLRQGYKLQALQPGQQLVWFSPYPKHEAEQFGEAFITQCGFKPDREMGFIYRAVCEPNGAVTLQSQTVDRSNTAAFAAVERANYYDPTIDLDALVRIYDGTLVQQFGGHFYAGRRESEVNENAWKEVQKHRDLLEYYLEKLEALAHQTMPRTALEIAVKKAVYGFWAALSKRLDGSAELPGSYQPNAGFGYGIAQRAMLEAEHQQAYKEFVTHGKVLVGCNGAIEMFQGEDSILNADGSNVFSAIFGNRKESYTFDKKMFCVVCQAPPKGQTEKKWCGPCGICKGCDVKLQAKNADTFAFAA